MIVLKMELGLINYFKDILEEIKERFKLEIKDTNIVANFLVYSAMFGILRRWALKLHYSNEQIIDYLLNTQLKDILPQL